jgi:hypothetical protein
MATKYYLSIQKHSAYGLYKELDSVSMQKIKYVNKGFLFFRWVNEEYVFDEEGSRRIASQLLEKYKSEGKLRIVKMYSSEYSEGWQESEVIWENGEWK